MVRLIELNLGRQATLRSAAVASNARVAPGFQPVGGILGTT